MATARDICVVCTAVFVVFIVQSHVLHTDAHIWRRQASSASSMGTTLNIEDIFKGRCYEHVQCVLTDRCEIPRTNVDCELVWGEFLSVFQYQDPCNTSADAYDGVLQMAPPITPAGQTLFWSGLLEAALNVARVSKQYRILEETLPGYMANNLMWCGDSKSQRGINYTRCPSSRECVGETGFTFWRAASSEFARQATGNVSVALNAHRKGGAFRNDSVFATVELPNLDTKKVDFVEILLVPDIKMSSNKSSERCDTGSILVLQRMIEERGLNWKCTYDPLEFRYIQCTTLDNPQDYPACSSGFSIIGLNIWSYLTLCLLGYVLRL